MIFKLKMARTVKLLTAGLAIACLCVSLLLPMAYASGLPKGTVTLTVGQSVTADGLASSSGSFTYRLTPKTASAPMPAGSDPSGYTFTVTGTGSADVGPIAFSASGIYTYELKCISGPEGSASDQQVYKVEVYVENDLTTLVIVQVSDGGKAAEISFGQLVKTGSGNGSDSSSSSGPGNPKADDANNPGNAPGTDGNNTIDTNRPDNAGGASGGGGMTNTENAYTGDNSNPVLWMTLAIGSGCFLMILLFVRKPRETE